jgi:hypothetical protein
VVFTKTLALEVKSLELQPNIGIRLFRKGALERLQCRIIGDKLQSIRS